MPTVIAITTHPQRVIFVRVDLDTSERFRRRAQSQGRSMAGHVRWLIKEDLGE